MKDFDVVLCLCPPGRFFLVSLVLSTWTHVRRFVLTTDDSTFDPGEFSAVIVMDELVTKARVDRLARAVPVIVLAWNGLFEIRRYKETLGEDADVIFMGTDETVSDSMFRTPLRYLPMINGDCLFEQWRALARDKRQFVVKGNALYRLRWLRTCLFANRWLCVVISAIAAAVRRPRTLRQTIESGFVANKFVWAGNCRLDLSLVDSTTDVRTAMEQGAEAVQAAPSSTSRLRAGADLVRRWREQGAPVFGTARAHEAFYVFNTLVRWAVLAYLSEAAKGATWFFGSDNVGLKLACELDLYHLVGRRRVAYLEFGGKTSETSLYPRSLHLLARRCYVISFAASEWERGSEETPSTIERIHRGLARGAESYFTELEIRRRSVYENLPSDCALRDVQQRVWADFARDDA